MQYFRLVLVVSLVLLFSACGGSGDDDGTPPTNGTPVPTVAPTPSPTSLPPTESPEPTPTNSPTPTVTPTTTATPIPTSTPTTTPRPGEDVAPVIEPVGHQRIAIGNIYTFTPQLSVGESVQWEKSFGPDEVSVDAATGAIRWDVSEETAAESYYLGVIAKNQYGSSEQIWIVTLGDGDVVYIPDDFADIWAAHHNSTGARSGSTIIIRDGVYSGERMGITSGGGDMTMPPAGTSEAFTTVMAETPGGVVIEDQSWSIAGKFSDYGYVAVKGLFFKSGGISIGTSDEYCSPLCTHHIKVSYTGAEGHRSTFGTSHANYILFENNYAYGAGRYKLSIYASQNVVVRRMVARMDLSALVGDYSPYGTYTSYNSDNVVFQNIIDIDSDSNAEAFWPNGQRTGAFWTIRDSAENIVFDRAIVVNSASGVGGAYGTNVSGIFKNIVGWDVRGNLPGPESGSAFLMPAEQGSELEHFTLGNISAPTYLLNGWKAHQALLNSLIVDYVSDDGLGVAFQVEEMAYNNFFNVPDVPTNGPEQDAATYTYVNPYLNSLKYLPRIEENSDLSSSGMNGTYIGASVTTFIGKSGTFYGDPGWNDETGISMWPFPNETLIQAKMKSFEYSDGEGNTLSGNRGFAQDGATLYGGPKTLTSYIWEYLGNPCPADICRY